MTEHYPPWLSPDLFPGVENPVGPWGLIGGADGGGAVESPLALDALVREDGGRTYGLAWTPESPFLVSLYEPEVAADAVLARDQVHWTGRLPGARRSLVFFLGVLAAGVAASFLEPRLFRVGALIILIVLIDLWEKGPNVLLAARSALRLIGSDPDLYRARENASLRYGHWAALRRPWGTWVLTGILAILFLLQLRTGLGISVWEAGLVKDRVRDGETWRLLTAGLLHGSVPHVLFNGLALVAVGRLVESLVGRWRLITAFVVSVLAGSLASFVLMPEMTSVGASGGVLGLGGVLVGLAMRRPEIRDAGLARAMARWLLVLALIGLVGWSFIDNAAHGGGLLGGIVVGLLIAPRTPDAYPPRFTRLGRLIHGLAALTLLAGAIGIGLLLT